MLYSTLTIKEKEYKLRLDAKACIEAEKKLGTNPLNIFIKQSGIPQLGDMLIILHCALQTYQHGISMEDTYRIFDEYCEEGHDLTEFTEVIYELFANAGFIPKDESKNA